jgi:hypothetical protein
MTNPTDTEMLAGEIVDESEKDWTYLLEKSPASNHLLFAKIMREKLGNEAVDNATPEQMIYWLLAMHRWMQKTEANRAREEFHGRTVGSVLKGSATLAERLGERNQEELLVTPVRLGIAAVEEKPKPVARKPRRQPTGPGRGRNAASKAAAKPAEAGSEWTEADKDAILQPTPKVNITKELVRA